MSGNKETRVFLPHLSEDYWIAMLEGCFSEVWERPDHYKALARQAGMPFKRFVATCMLRAVQNHILKLLAGEDTPPAVGG